MNSLRALKLSDYETLRFLELYEREEILYNPRIDAYRDRDARLAAAKRIAVALKVPGFGPSEAIAKFKNLRNSYSQELKKIAESQSNGNSTNDVYIPKVAWFGKMDTFIRPFMHQRTSKANFVCKLPNNYISIQKYTALDDRFLAIYKSFCVTFSIYRVTLPAFRFSSVFFF